MERSVAKKPKALFFNVPAHGHVNPSLPLVAELVRRGHQITYFLTAGFRAQIEAAGATLQPYTSVRDDYFAGPGLDGSRPQRAAQQLITTAGEILPELLAAAERMQPDYILYDGMCPWGYLLARHLRLPAVVSLSLLPLVLPPLRELLRPETFSTLAGAVLHDFGAGMQAVRRARELGQQYGAPPLGLGTILNAPGDLAISYTSAWFAPYAERAAETVRFVGWTLRTSPADAAWTLPQAEGRRLIYVSLGTLVAADAAFFRTCIDALAGRDEFVLISTGKRFGAEAFGALPANVLVRPWVPQAAVLQQAALFVTHAGMGSVHDGLYCGVPLLLVPQQAEQTLTARRVAQLGAGLLLKQGEVSIQTVRDRAARLLAEPAFAHAAQHIGESLRAAGGVTRAGEEIEKLLHQMAA